MESQGYYLSRVSPGIQVCVVDIAGGTNSVTQVCVGSPGTKVVTDVLSTLQWYCKLFKWYHTSVRYRRSGVKVSNESKSL